MKLRQKQRQNNCDNCDKTLIDWLLVGLIAICSISVHHHKTPLMTPLEGFLIFTTTIATKLGMTKGKKHPYKEAKLVHGKRAYIGFYAYSESDESLIRKRVFCPAKFKTVAMIERWANNLIPQINTGLENGFHFKSAPIDEKEGLKVDTIKHKLTDILEKVIDAKNAQLRAKTAGTYQTAYRKFLDYLKEKERTNIYIEEFANTDAYEYRDYLLTTRKNSNRTVNNNLIWIRSFFEGALERGYINKNPIAVKMLPETDSDQHEVFSLEHQIVFEEWLKDNDFQLYVFTRVLYYAFLRPNELRSITLANLDLQKRIINVPGKIAKNRRTETIPISQTLYSTLLEYNRIVLNDNNQLLTQFLFGKGMITDKVQMSINYAYERHKRALLACGLQDYNYTLYSWKHTGASRAYEVTKDILRLSKLLRHASTKETENYLRSIGVRLKSDPLEYDW